ncbi:MAG TPA: RNA polymerase subunit sigma [Desulfotomaculum sp.]|nr:RNA polymerase subunit sigma [Desulfotomaculum sp.]HCJ78723.1 RNA polymerase subunit sigma [Desulfotomaculum sp.]
MVFLFPGKNEAQLRSSFSEEDIIEEAKSGNQQAFNQIIEHYTPFAYRLAYVILQNEQDAQDAVQDAFLRCYLKLASFHRNSTLQTWLYRVVVNCCTDILRKKQRDQSVCANLARENTFLENTNTVEENLDLKLDLKNILATFTPEYRATLVLYYGFGLKVREVAKTLGVPAGTVKSRLHTARKSIQKCLLRK